MAQSYDVWIGPNAGALVQVGNDQSARSYVPTMALDSTYCIRIDSKNTFGTTTGDVTRFSTWASADIQLDSEGNPVTDSEGSYIATRTALNTWYAGLADSASSPCDIVHIGDSISEGYPMATRAVTWQALLRNKLRARYQPSGVVGGGGYIPADRVTTSFSDDGVTLAGGASESDAYGLARRCAIFTGAGQTATLVVTGVTRVDIIYPIYGSAAAFDYTVNGGSAVRVNIPEASASDGQVASITSLTPATNYTIVITQAVGAFFINGFFLYNGDTLAGIRTWDSARAGSRGYWLNEAPNWYKGIGVIAPKLVTIEIGINDRANGDSTTTYRSTIEAMIANIRAQTTNDPSIVVIRVWVDGSTNHALWQPYIDVMYAVAAADAGVCIFDAEKLIGKTSTDTYASGLLVDETHLSVSGNELFADALFNYLLP
jgi:lysophospholipase L1-like esterase